MLPARVPVPHACPLQSGVGIPHGVGTSREKWVPHFAGISAFALVDGLSAVAPYKVGWVLGGKSGYPTSRGMAGGTWDLGMLSDRPPGVGTNGIDGCWMPEHAGDYLRRLGSWTMWALEYEGLTNRGLGTASTKSLWPVVSPQDDATSHGQRVGTTHHYRIA